MGIYQEAPFNSDAYLIHKNIRELNENHNSKVIFVAEGDAKSSKNMNSYVSFGFSVCSGILLQNTSSGTSGFIHLYPGEEMDKLDKDEMEASRGSQMIVIEGSDSTYKMKLIRKIEAEYDLKYVKTIPIETDLGLLHDRKFHIVYRPSENKVLVARISHKDVLSFDAF